MVSCRKNIYIWGQNMHSWKYGIYSIGFFIIMGTYAKKSEKDFPVFCIYSTEYIHYHCNDWTTEVNGNAYTHECIHNIQCKLYLKRRNINSFCL